jgi:fucose permease
MLLPLQGLLADKIGILNSYVLTILLFAYLFTYAVVLSRPRNNMRKETEKQT